MASGKQMKDALKRASKKKGDKSIEELLAQDPEAEDDLIKFIIDKSKFDTQEAVDSSKLPAIYKAPPPDNAKGLKEIADESKFTMNDPLDPSKLPAKTQSTLEAEFTDVTDPGIKYDKSKAALAAAGVGAAGAAAAGASGYWGDDEEDLPKAMPAKVAPVQAKPSGPAVGSLPDKAEGAEYEKFRSDIMRIESAGDASAINPESGATGKYQFMPRYWDEKAQERMGKSIRELTPEEQDQFFKIYYEEDVMPAVRKIRAEGKNGPYSDRAIAGMIHRSGEPGARDFLATGKDKFEGVQGNDNILDYLAKMGGKTRTGSGSSSSALASGGPPQPPNLEEALSDNDNEPLIRYANLPTSIGEDPSFNQQLSEIRNEFRAAKDNMEKREIGHTLAEALTQLGAGYAGLKTGTDMSGIKFKQTDFDAKYRLLLDEFKTNLADLDSRRVDDRQRREKAAELGVTQTKMAREDIKDSNKIKLDTYKAELDAWQAGQKAQHDAATLEYYKATAAAKDANADEATKQRADQKFQEAKAKASQSAAKFMADKKSDPKAKAASIGMVLTPLGVPAAAIDDALFEPGMLWGTNARDETEASAKINTLLESLQPPSAGGGPQPVKVKAPSGKEYTFPNEQAANEAVKKGGAGWQRI